MLPLATSTFTIERASNIDGDSGDPLTFSTVDSGVPGTSMFYSGSASVAHGDRERVDARIALDIDYALEHTDVLTDEQTGDVWKVAWVRKRIGLGLDHYIVGCYQVTGTARGTRDL
jgi:hypothetical protein